MKKIIGYGLVCGCCDDLLTAHMTEDDKGRIMVFLDKKQALLEAVDYGVDKIHEVEIVIRSTEKAQ